MHYLNKIYPAVTIQRDGSVIKQQIVHHGPWGHDYWIGGRRYKTTLPIGVSPYRDDYPFQSVEINGKGWGYGDIEFIIRTQCTTTTNSMLVRNEVPNSSVLIKGEYRFLHGNQDEQLFIIPKETYIQVVQHNESISLNYHWDGETLKSV